MERRGCRSLALMLMLSVALLGACAKKEVTRPESQYVSAYETGQA